MSERYEFRQLILVSYLHFSAVQCPGLNEAINGTISCSLEDDGIPTYEDTCSFTCNTGYELTGSSERTCQSNGSWSGSDIVCRRGKKYKYYTLN